MEIFVMGESIVRLGFHCIPYPHEKGSWNISPNQLQALFPAKVLSSSMHPLINSNSIAALHHLGTITITWM